MDKDLIIELYKTQWKIIYGYLLRSGCKREEAEDIVQEAFIKAIEYMDGVDSNKINSWLFTVTLNILRTRYKKNKRIVLSFDEEEFINKLWEEDNSDYNLLSEECSQYVNIVLDDMKEEQKRLLALKYMGELSYKDIGILLGFNENTVKTYLFRAREEFKKRWRDSYE